MKRWPWLFVPTRRIGEFWCRRIDEDTVAYEHPYSVVVLASPQATLSDVSPQLLPLALHEWGYRYVERVESIRAEVWAVWWWWPVLKARNALVEAFCEAVGWRG